MTLPKITIVTPSFNQGRFLEETILSVLNQGYPELEYMIFDGGSTDESKGIIAKYSDRLSYWCSEPDRGQADALKKGFARATGDILCWLNSDDIFLPGALSAVGSYFTNHPETEVVNGGGFVINEYGDPLLDGFWTYTEGVAATYRRLKWYGQDGVFQMSTFWRRTAYEAVGGIDPDLFFLIDKDLFVRLAKRRPFDSIPQLLACFRMHGSSKSCLAQTRRNYEETRFAARYRHQRGSALLYPPCTLSLEYRVSGERSGLPAQ
ncbi:MAG TPA: glycosyltransferase family 2 protein [Bryobacteraceae bacterium]|nr:glycosyltransferase family 2 protein [Bryobacteraceae bacterium]